MKQKKKIPLVKLLSFVALIILVSVVVFSLSTRVNKFNGKANVKEKMLFIVDKMDEKLEQSINETNANEKNEDEIISDTKENDTNQSSEDSNIESNNINISANSSNNDEEKNSSSNNQTSTNSKSTSINNNSNTTTNNNSSTNNSNDSGKSVEVEDNSVNTHHFDYHIHKGYIECHSRDECDAIAFPKLFQFNGIIAYPNYIDVMSNSNNSLGYFIEYVFNEVHYLSQNECQQKGNEVKNSLSNKVTSYKCQPIDNGFNLKIYTNYD